MSGRMIVHLVKVGDQGRTVTGTVTWREKTTVKVHAQIVATGKVLDGGIAEKELRVRVEPDPGTRMHEIATAIRLAASELGAIGWADQITLEDV